MAFGEFAILHSKHTVRSVHRVAKHSTNHKYFGRQREIPSLVHSCTLIYLFKNATIICILTFCLFDSLSLEINFFKLRRITHLTLNIPRVVLWGPQRVIFCDPAVTITNSLLIFVCVPHQLKINIMQLDF